MKLFDNKIEFGGYMAACVVLLLVLPAMNAFFPADSALHFSSFQLSLWGKYITYAVMAMSLNLLWGYTGLLCLCQSLFFALGAYAFGMYLMLHVGVDSVYNTALPDFMDFQGYTELPWYWAPFENGAFAIAATMLVPGVLAFVFGFLAFRSRIKGVYFSILTQALTYAASLFFFKNNLDLFGNNFILFGGNNGLTDFKEVFGYDVNAASTQRWIFVMSAILMLVVYLVIAWLLKTKFGKVQQAIRDSENRVRFSGYSTTTYKMLIFVGTSMVAGIAGAFYVPQVGGINANEMTPAKSLDVVVWVALGGRGTKFGPIIGAIVVNIIKSFTTRAYPDSWLIILGAIFMLVVLFMPNGLVGLPKQLAPLWARIRSNATTSATPAS
ncbi:urea ABC transporter permease subunit UrtC [Pelagicoccus sp. SDUM812005]|uniref:urea ABC transporter permease subunit UrtC n=1 Tax=Pelagicoccus sp. SDUM812005 TaxID=3041257 RepID=UPI00280F8AB7|nr:urea ABC transporter permease subunit UrtC [Pelagicoccus sp. SDUM812005]MDQ8180491.1 urea ABC transporter permease subunit UrtC [Pelagicoccus sp. SDUM812005]